MLKYLAILAAVIVVVRCNGGYGPPPPGECKPCKTTMDRAFELVASMAKGMEPIEMKNVSICKKVILTIGPSTMTTHGKPCMISEPAPSKNKWQMCGFKLVKLHVECHIIPIAEFGSVIGVNIPVPNFSVPGFGSTTEVHQVINVDGQDLAFEFNSVINFEEDSCNMTKLEMVPGDLKTMKIYLTGDTVFTKMGEAVTGPEPVRCALGFVVQQVLRLVISKVLDGDKLKEFITMLNCGDTDY